MRLFLDTDPDGTGRRARWWAVLAVLVVVILAEVIVTITLITDIVRV